MKIMKIIIEGERNENNVEENEWRRNEEEIMKMKMKEKKKIMKEA
jgi:hypothetical protein